jgi:hypothetical protein
MGPHGKKESNKYTIQVQNIVSLTLYIGKNQCLFIMSIKKTFLLKIWLLACSIFMHIIISLCKFLAHFLCCTTQYAHGPEVFNEQIHTIGIGRVLGELCSSLHGVLEFADQGNDNH